MKSKSKKKYSETKKVKIILMKKKITENLKPYNTILIDLNSQ